MNMQEPSGEYLRREHLYVYAGFQKMKPTRTGAALPLAKLQVEYLCRRSIFIDSSELFNIAKLQNFVQLKLAFK